MLYLVNPRKRGTRKRARRKKKPRSAAQKAATRKMLAARKRATAGRKKKARTTKRSTSMARKARKRTVSRKRRRTAKRRSPGVRLVRRGVAVYQGNPRRRRRSRRRGYRRNPGIVSMVKQGAMDAVATLGGGAAARIVTGFVPLPDAGITGVAKGLGVAVAIGYASRKFLSSDTARFVTAGAMQVPIKNLITTFVPGAGAYLGEYDNVGAYIAGDDVSGYVSDVQGVGELYEGVGEYVHGY